MKKQKNWFQDWFDTKYYHILYRDRDTIEAQLFMQNLTSFLQLKQHSKILDLPCGKGRHAIYLNTLGYDVLGADLSANSINYAKQFENDTLKFKVHDMRDPFSKKFNAIFNLFTSFGYFDDTTNIKVLKNLKKGLKDNGVLVIDFLNVNHVKKHLITEEIVYRDTIDFKINRYVDVDFIVKDIRYTVDNEKQHHTEYVRNINLDIFKMYFTKAELKLKYIFGDYNLNTFNQENSPRLILIVA